TPAGAGGGPGARVARQCRIRGDGTGTPDRPPMRLAASADRRGEGPAMIPTAKRGNVLLTAALAVAVTGLGASRAEAQWGWGGFGFGGGPYVPQPVTEIDQYTGARMRPVPRPTPNTAYPGNPNADSN